MAYPFTIMLRSLFTFRALFAAFGVIWAANIGHATATANGDGISVFGSYSVHALPTQDPTLARVKINYTVSIAEAYTPSSYYEGGHYYLSIKNLSSGVSEAHELSGQGSFEYDGKPGTYQFTEIAEVALIDPTG